MSGMTDTLPRTYFDDLIADYLARFPADETRLLSARRRFYETDQLDIIHRVIDRALQEEQRIDWQTLMGDGDAPISHGHLQLKSALNPPQNMPRLSL